MRTLLTTNFVCFVFAICFAAPLNAQVMVDFEDVGTTLASDAAYRGEDTAGGFSSGGVTFNNSYGTFPGGDFWSGNAYSNRTTWASGGFVEYANGNDTTLFQNTDGSANVGVNGSSTWGVVFGSGINDSQFRAPAGQGFQSFNFHNTQTTADIIVNGNIADGGFSVPFDENDEFGFIINRLAEVVGLDGTTTLEIVASTEKINLTNAGAVREDWFEYDLSGTPVAGASLIGFEFFSTDVNSFGIVTPAYVAVDNIELIAVAVPEPSSIAILGVCALTAVLRRRKL